MPLEPMDVVIPVILAGNQTVADNKVRFQMPFHGEVISVTGTAGTSPEANPGDPEADPDPIPPTAAADAALIYDVLIEGTSIFTTSSRRPTIDVGDTEIDAAEIVVLPEAGEFQQGDLLTVNCEQIGDGDEVGADVVLILHLQRR